MKTVHTNQQLIDQERKLLKETNAKLRANGQPTIGIRQLRRLKTMKKAYLMEGDRIKEIRDKMISRIVNIVTIIGSLILYYILSKALSELLGLEGMDYIII